MCSRTVVPCRLLLTLLLLLLAAAAATVHRQFHRTYRSGDSQLHWINGSSAARGFITTEGFDDPPWTRRDARYAATWLLEAPVGHGVIAYMTQYHLPNGDLKVESFNICIDKRHGMVRCSWDRPVAKDASSSLETASKMNEKPVRSTTEFMATTRGDSWLVLSVDVPAGGADGCLLSSESHGFNITYEMVKLTGSPETSVRALARRDRCWVQSCNLNGDCLASADFRRYYCRSRYYPAAHRRYYCRCRPGYYGDRCQHGTLCDPNNQVNPCQNNGTCRQRRDVAECKCPPPYYGTRCEQKLEGLQEPNYCRRFHELHCDVGCVSEGSAFRCACPPGHRLLANGSCCCPPDLRRYIIELTVTDNDIQLDNSNIESRLGFNHSIYNQSEPVRVTYFDNSADSQSSSRRLQLLLIALRADEPAVYRWFADGVSGGSVGAVGVRPLKFSFHSEPQLAITSLTMNSQNGGQTVGSQVHLSCTVRGTDRTQVHWYKDNARINVTRVSLLRVHQISEGSVPLGGEEYNHYLTVSRVVAEDEGRFQCVAEDRHSSEPARHAIQLRLPSLQLALRISPPLTSVRPGRNVTISCTLRSSKQNRNDSILIWSKAVGRGPFRPLTAQDHEQVVTFCWGRSVLIIRKPETARYECEVRLPPLSNRVTADVLVLNAGQQTCPRVQEGSVTWQETAAGREDIQPCPGDDEDVELPGRILKVPARYARRLCERLAKSRSHWRDPDFSGCVDRQLFILQKQMDQLMAGYDVSSPESVLAEMHVLMQQRLEEAQARKPARLLAAEVEAFRRLLVNIASYLITVASDEQLKGVDKDFIGTMTPLFGAAGAAQLSDEDKAELITAKMKFLLRRVFLPPLNASHPEMFIISRQFRYVGDAVQVIMPFHTHRRPGWVRTVAEISLAPDQPWRSYVLPASELGLVVAVNRDTRALYPHGYTPDDNADDLGRSGELFVLDSRLVSIGLSKRPRLLESPFPPSVKVALRMEPLSRHWNESNQRHSCAQLSENGRWRLDACQIRRGNDSVTCHCDWLGTYALALVTEEPSRLGLVVRSLHVPVVVGCLLALLVLLYSAAVLLLHCWRRPSVPAGLQLQGALVLTAAITGFMVSARDAPKQSGQWLAISAACLQCLVLSAMSTQMALKMHVFGEQFRLKRMRGEPNYFKYIVFFISTGVPLLITAATVTVQVTHGWHQVRSWWILHGSSFFYGVVVPVAALLLADTLLLLYVRAMLTLGAVMLGRERHAWIQTRVSLMMRSHVLESMLVVLVMASALYVNFEGVACQVVFAVCCVLTSITLLMCYVIQGDPGIQTRPCAKNKPSADKKIDGDSPQPPATLRSHATLGTVDPSQKPLLPRCGCRPSPAISPNDTIDSGSGSGSGSVETDECAISSTPGSSAASSSISSDSGASQRHAPAGRQPQPPSAATRAAPLQVEADVITADTDAFDPPPKPGREAARGAALPAQPGRPGSSTNGVGSREQRGQPAGPARPGSSTNGVGREELQRGQPAGPSRYRAAANRLT